MAAESVHTCVTSPPYFGLRDYGMEGQLGLESTPEAYIARLVGVFAEVRRVLRDDATLWVNIGDSYAGSGKGRDADGTWNPGKGGSKQETNVGAIVGQSARANAVTKLAGDDRNFGYKPKDLIGIPWMLAFALRADGWYLRSEVIWAKPNAMPESVTDRPTKAHEQIFLLSKSPRYFYDAAAIRTPLTDVSLARVGRADLREKDGWAEAYGGNPPGGLKQDLWKGSSFDQGKTGEMKTTRGGTKSVKFGGNNQCPDTRLQSGNEWNPETDGANKKSVWTVSTVGFREAHFATFPPKLIEPCILAGCPEGGTVMDPFTGAGTTGLVALRHGRNFVGIELNPEYAAMAERRIMNDAPLLNVRTA